MKEEQILAYSNQTPGKLVNFTKDDIKDYLEELKKLIMDNQYIISKRDENIAFAYEYRIDTAKEKEILLNLKHSDFCYAAVNYNTKPEFAHEKLYVFCKEYELDHWGNPEIIDIYIKANLTQTRKGNDFMIIVSFHKLNNPIKYLFR